MYCRLFLAAVLLVVAAGCEASGRGPALPAAMPGAAPVTITSEPTGVSVTVDGVIVGEAPLTISLNPGPHRVRGTKSGYYPAQESRIQVSRGEAQTHHLTLVASH